MKRYSSVRAGIVAAILLLIVFTPTGLAHAQGSNTVVPFAASRIGLGTVLFQIRSLFAWNSERQNELVQDRVETLRDVQQRCQSQSDIACTRAAAQGITRALQTITLATPDTAAENPLLGSVRTQAQPQPNVDLSDTGLITLWESTVYALEATYANELAYQRNPLPLNTSTWPDDFLLCRDYLIQYPPKATATPTPTSTLVAVAQQAPVKLFPPECAPLIEAGYQYTNNEALWAAMYDGSGTNTMYAYYASLLGYAYTGTLCTYIETDLGVIQCATTTEGAYYQLGYVQELAAADYVAVRNARDGAGMPRRTFNGPYAYGPSFWPAGSGGTGGGGTGTTPPPGSTTSPPPGTTPTPTFDPADPDTVPIHFSGSAVLESTGEYIHDPDITCPPDSIRNTPFDAGVTAVINGETTSVSFDVCDSSGPRFVISTTAGAAGWNSGRQAEFTISIPDAGFTISGTPTIVADDWRSETGSLNDIYNKYYGIGSWVIVPTPPSPTPTATPGPGDEEKGVILEQIIDTDHPLLTGCPNVISSPKFAQYRFTVDHELGADEPQWSISSGDSDLIVEGFASDTAVTSYFLAQADPADPLEIDGIVINSPGRLFGPVTVSVTSNGVSDSCSYFVAEQMVVPDPSDKTVHLSCPQAGQYGNTYTAAAWVGGDRSVRFEWRFEDDTHSSANGRAFPIGDPRGSHLKGVPDGIRSDHDFSLPYNSNLDDLAAIIVVLAYIEDLSNPQGETLVSATCDVIIPPFSDLPPPSDPVSQPSANTSTSIFSPFTSLFGPSGQSDASQGSAQPQNAPGLAPTAAPGAAPGVAQPGVAPPPAATPSAPEGSAAIPQSSAVVPRLFSASVSYVNGIIDAFFGLFGQP